MSKTSEYLNYLVNGGNFSDLPMPTSVNGALLYELCLKGISGGGGGMPTLDYSNPIETLLLSTSEFTYTIPEDGYLQCAITSFSGQEGYVNINGVRVLSGYGGAVALSQMFKVSAGDIITTKRCEGALFREKQ